MVFVLDKRGKPLMPCTEKRARLLLSRQRARVHRVLPMVIRLRDRTQDSCHLQPLRVKIDPGSKTTGLALVRESESIDFQSGQIKRRATVLLLMELAHRGRQISEALTARRNMRRRRRGNLPAALQTGPWLCDRRHDQRLRSLGEEGGPVRRTSRRPCFRVFQHSRERGHHPRHQSQALPAHSAK
jgi:hypothetical protein